jgi:dipeptidyl aminopeptidase/acylaminoacyl peptidase
MMIRNHFSCIVFVCLLLHISLSLDAQKNKIPLDHSVYDGWKTISNAKISNDGNWVSYEINPGRGDGWLYLYNVKHNSLDSVGRGYDAVFSNQSDWIVFRIKPQYEKARKARIDKVTKDKMPKDSLGIWLLGAGKEPVKYPDVQSFKVPEDGTGWLAFQHFELPDSSREAAAANDTSKSAKRGKKDRGSDLMILNPAVNKAFKYKNVVGYSVSRQGKAIGFIQESNDTVPVCTVSFFDPGSEKKLSVFEATGKAPLLALDDPGRMMAFLYHSDTAKISGFDIYLWDALIQKTSKIVDSLSEGIPSGWGVSKNGDLWFSKDNDKLFFNTAPIPGKEIKDTVPDDEKYHVDIWTWQDTLLQPQQKVELDRTKRKSYLAVWLIRDQKIMQLADKLIGDVMTLHRGSGYIALGLSVKPYERIMSWEASRYRDVYVLNMAKQTKQLLMKRKSSLIDLSPHGKYIAWYETEDSTWYAHDIAEDRLISLTGQIPVNFYNEEFDEPNDPWPYGFAGWTEDDRFIFIYDRYDIWKIDASGRNKPLNLTNGSGRAGRIQYRYIKADREAYYISQKEPMLLSGFNEINKDNGIYSASPVLSKNPVPLATGPYYYDPPEKARYSEGLIFRRSDFRNYPDIYLSDMKFSFAGKISNANPQASDYLWGNTRLVKWKAFDGTEMEGILYTPEVLVKTRKYPMLVYFYERSSAGLNRHYAPSPSRSTINIAWCVSNGYIVFVPDIKYKTGHPGESAYNCVVSGTKAMSDQFSFIDTDNIGIQGQSWGGYQVAFLVTRTNIYKAAMAGAPVSNMTSAYGGIRWAAGVSRMWQYEKSQSRIGGTLWDKTSLYLENSPIFSVPEIETPLLIMHNDNDGAVPWYQGIELFTALRRLDKPAWMLVYNNEEHNLEKWPDRVDLSIRMMQFFDHFLKGAPAPEWMVRGIPAVSKGNNNGYNLIEDQ